MFRLSSGPLETPRLDNDRAGGFVLFEGRVRSQSGTKDVVRLEYEAHEELAVAEGVKVVQEAVSRFGLSVADVIHRIGPLQVGETAVVIQTSAPHRREAFAACEWIIDQLKIRVPIWKREFYRDGDSGWVGSDAPPAPAVIETEFFRRQVIMPEVGLDGLDRLKAARVLVVGAGGLAAGFLPPLVGGGVGHLTIIDPDVVQLSNLHRQTLYRADEVGRGKAERAASFASRLRPGVDVHYVPEWIHEDNVDRFVSSHDWVVDGTDSLDVRFILNAACRRHGRPLVTAGVHRFEGQLMTVLPDGPCLNCLFPDPPPDGCVGTCAEDGVLGVLPSLIGQLQANEVLKGILGYGPLLAEDILFVDLRTGLTEKLGRSRRADCPGCRGELMSGGLSLTLDQARARWAEFTVVDIRAEATPELPVPHIVDSTEDLSTLPSGPLVLCCYKGIMSQPAALRLRALGRADVWSLKGGAAALSP